MSESARITSRQNPRIKDAARLRTGRERQRAGRLLIEGAREIDRAVMAEVRLIDAFVCDEMCTSDECQRLVASLEKCDCNVCRVSPDVYGKLAFGDRQDGIVVVAESPRRTLSDLKLPADPLVAVLEGVEKPGNVGAILRSADAADVDAVIVADGRTDLYNPNTIRASLGTVFRQNVCDASAVDTINWLGAKSLSIIAARPDAKTLYTEVSLRGSVAIVLGSETVGLTNAWSAAGITAVRLPMHGLADSLNVSTTAAVLFYEALRQRG